MRSQVEHDLITSQQACSAIIQRHLDRLRPQTPAPHDQLGAARLIGVQMKGDLAFDHRLLAAANRHHVGRDRPRHRAEPIGVADEMRDSGTPQLVLARHAGDRGA
jgi:hypothetical protein